MGEEKYPCVVELCLDAYEVAFFLVLRAQDLELGGLERTGRNQRLYGRTIREHSCEI